MKVPCAKECGRMTQCMTVACIHLAVCTTCRDMVTKKRREARRQEREVRRDAATGDDGIVTWPFRGGGNPAKPNKIES